MLRRLKDDAIPRPVRELCRVLEGKGHRAWVVGGCVRDLLMGREVSDWDLATSALPDEVKRAFRRTIPTGIAHGTMTVLHEGEAYEVTTLRGEGAYSDGRRPDSVEFVREIEEDLARRDFTVNAIAFDPLTDELVDPWGGLRDLEAGVIRAVRDPVERFSEDGLRVLRAARFSATLGFELEPKTEAAIPGSLETFRKVSPERVHEEWKKTLSTGRPSPAFEVMRRTGILAITAAPLAALADDAFARTMTRIDRAPPDVDLRMAALLLDVEPDEPRATWADEFLRSLRASNQERKRTVHLIEHSPVPSSESLDDAALRRWLSTVGRDAVFDALAIARADGMKTLELRQRIEAELDRGLPLSARELPIGGNDVMEALGTSPGRAIGDILSWLLDRVLEDPELADRARLLALVPEAYRAVTEGSAATEKNA